MLYRYELTCDGERQDVGFMTGLSELETNGRNYDHLLDAFRGLPVPRLPPGRYLSFFTEKGMDAFKDGIKELIDAYYDDGLFEVMECIIDTELLSADDVVYEDDFQAAVKESVVHGMGHITPQVHADSVRKKG